MASIQSKTKKGYFQLSYSDGKNRPQTDEFLTRITRNSSLPIILERKKTLSTYPPLNSLFVF